MLSNEEVQALEELEQKATPTRFRVEKAGIDGIEGRRIIRSEHIVENHDHEYVALTSEFNSVNFKEDADYIVALLNAAKSLIQSARREKAIQSAFHEANLHISSGVNWCSGRDEEDTGYLIGFKDALKIIEQALKKGTE